MLGLDKTHTVQKKGTWLFKQNITPAASLKRSKHGLGRPKHAFPKRRAFLQKKSACGSERLVNMAWGYQNMKNVMSADYY